MVEGGKPKCPRSATHSASDSVRPLRSSLSTTQKLELQYHDDVIRTKAVATKEGVWKGVLRPGDLLKANYRWIKGLPITMNHPVDGVTDAALAVGQVVDVEWDDAEKRVIADCELWASKCPPELVTKIAAGDPVDVSTGYYADQEPIPGKFGDQEYAEVEKSLFFDHLAIVPVGACASSDGCGMGSHTGLDGNMKSHSGKEKAINESKEGVNMLPDIKIESLEDLTKFTQEFEKLDDKEIRSRGVEAFKLLSTMATGKTGLFAVPKAEPPEKVSYPMPKVVKAQDSETRTLDFDITEDPEAAKGAFTAVYGEAIKTIAERDATIATLKGEKEKLQEEKDTLEGSVRKEQIAVIQAHSGLSDEEMKVYDTLPIPQLKAVATHMEKALQVHSKDPKTKFSLPEEGGKKLTVEQINADFDRALGFPPKKK